MPTRWRFYLINSESKFCSQTELLNKFSILLVLVFSDHTFYKSHSTSECDSSNHPVSVVVVVGGGVNFFSFSTSSFKPLHGFASNFVWMFFGWTPTEFVKIRVLPLFLMELWVILCNFWPILKKSSSI